MGKYGKVHFVSFEHEIKVWVDFLPKHQVDIEHLIRFFNKRLFSEISAIPKIIFFRKCQ